MKRHSCENEDTNDARVYIVLVRRLSSSRRPLIVASVDELLRFAYRADISTHARDNAFGISLGTNQRYCYSNKEITRTRSSLSSRSPVPNKQLRSSICSRLYPPARYVISFCQNDARYRVKSVREILSDRRNRYLVKNVRSMTPGRGIPRLATSNKRYCVATYRRFTSAEKLGYTTGLHTYTNTFGSVTKTKISRRHSYKARALDGRGMGNSTGRISGDKSRLY